MVKLTLVLGNIIANLKITKSYRRKFTLVNSQIQKLWRTLDFLESSFKSQMFKLDSF